jgi:hypothetical protein
VRKPKKSGTTVPHSKAALFLALAVFVGDLSAIALGGEFDAKAHHRRYDIIKDSNALSARL